MKNNKVITNAENLFRAKQHIQSNDQIVFGSRETHFK